MKIGLFFGSFNPVHVGHMIIAEHVANHTDLDALWMVVTPQNPLKNKKSYFAFLEKKLLNCEESRTIFWIV